MKIQLNTIENILFVKSKIDLGMTFGSLKKKYGIGHAAYTNLKNDNIDCENEHVKCLLCGKELDNIGDRHLKFCSGTTLTEYLQKFPNAKIIPANIIIKRSKSAIGQIVTDETKEKLRKHNLGKKHSAKTLAILSAQSAGNNNPACRADVKEKIKANHISRTNPEKWKMIIKSNGEKHRGYKFTPEQKNNMLLAREKSGKYGSKVQLYAHKYFDKYFSLFYKVAVKSNDSEPFLGHTDKFSIDITIPEFKIAIEWDGVWHRKPIFGDSHLLKVQNNDKAKDAILKNRGWKIIRIIDEIRHDKNYMKNVKLECRKVIKDIGKIINN
jgi:hypothetical protein